MTTGSSSGEDYVSTTHVFPPNRIHTARSGKKAFYWIGFPRQENGFLSFAVDARHWERGLRDIFVIRPNRYVPSGRKARDDVSMEAVTAEEST